MNPLNKTLHLILDKYKTMSRKSKLICFAIGFLLISAALIGPVLSLVETPAYEVLSSDGNIEVRRYAPMTLIEVDTMGEREDTVSDGFRMLADYIFGNNVVQQEMAMTAPVQQQQTPYARAKEIARAASIQQKNQDGLPWTISFVAPAQYTKETLPKPLDERIRLTALPEQLFVVITFSGTFSNSNLSWHESQLLTYIRQKRLYRKGPAKYAFYNPPITLPFLRRNEIMFELSQY